MESLEPSAAHVAHVARPAAAARDDLRRFAWLSIAAAIATIGLKSGAFLLTGSVGLLSDAAESVVNLIAAVVALIALTVAARPADDNHHFGHAKAEYFSAAIEGQMIFLAAIFIIVSAVERFINPRPIDNVGTGLLISVVASAINGAVAVLLLRVGRRQRSITLTADGKHLLTDVWTSAGVVVGVLLVALTGWLRLDPIVAILVGLNIVWTGWRLLSHSVGGLMDSTLDPGINARLNAALDEMTTDDVRFHALLTRTGGYRQFASVHVLVPGDWTVTRGHDLVEEVETRLLAVLDHGQVETHLEPIEDPRSYEIDDVGARPYRETGATSAAGASDGQVG